MLWIRGSYIFSFSETFLETLMSAGKLNSTTWQVFPSLSQIVKSDLLFLIFIAVFIGRFHQYSILPSQWINSSARYSTFHPDANLLQCCSYTYILLLHHALKEGNSMKTFCYNYLLYETHLQLDFGRVWISEFRWKFPVIFNIFVVMISMFSISWIVQQMIPKVGVRTGSAKTFCAICLL